MIINRQLSYRDEKKAFFLVVLLGCAVTSQAQYNAILIAEPKLQLTEGYINTVSVPVDAVQPLKEYEKAIGTVYASVKISNYYRKGEEKEVENKLYQALIDKTHTQYINYPNSFLRSLKMKRQNDDDCRLYTMEAVVSVVDPVAQINTRLSPAVEKALRNVRQGSRIAIDQFVVGSGLNREEYKDQVLDILLDNGYKVVAKEYLEKLYEEQRNQQSGIYNENTTVQENNFSAVGYFVNVKITESSIRVQVINVSTGEYECNATVKF